MTRFFTLCLFLGISILAHAQQGTLRLKTMNHQFRYPDMVNYDVLNYENTVLDNSICQDTLREYKDLLPTSFTTFSFRLRKYQTSYYTNGKKKQVLYSTGTDTLLPSLKTTYSYANVKSQPDTTLNEVWDSKNIKWNFSSKVLSFKSTNNKDSLLRSLDVNDKEVSYTKFLPTIDGKDSLILRVSSTTGLTLDSTLYVYDNQRRITLYRNLNYNTTTKVFTLITERKWQYDTDKLLSFNKSLYYSGTTPYYVDSTINYIYKGAILDTMVEKYIQRNAKTQVVMDSTIERSRYLTFNAAKKPVTIEMDVWDGANNIWKRMANVTREYLSDTLISKEIHTEIGIRTGIYTYYEYTTYAYETCQSLTSGANEIVQSLPFSIAPNPASSEIRINLSEDNINPAQLTIYSLQGTLIQSKQFIDSQSTIDVSSFPRGLYLVRVQQGNLFAVKKLTLF